jgi:hypothetical protein
MSCSGRGPRRSRLPRPSPLNSVFAGPEMDRPLVTTLASVALMAALPSMAWAEVMDKEPTLTRIWTAGLLTGVLGFFAWRRHVVLGVPVSLVAVLLAWAVHSELADPYVGPAILAEAGRSYFVQAYGVMLMCAALHIAGAAAGARARRQREAVAS